MADAVKRDLRHYAVVTAESPQALEDAVAGLMKRGLTPIGGVSVVGHEWRNERKGYSETTWSYAQAMVRK